MPEYISISDGHKRGKHNVTEKSQIQFTISRNKQPTEYFPMRELEKMECFNTIFPLFSLRRKEI